MRALLSVYASRSAEVKALTRDIKRYQKEKGYRKHDSASHVMTRLAFVLHRSCCSGCDQRTVPLIYSDKDQGNKDRRANASNATKNISPQSYGLRCCKDRVNIANYLTCALESPDDAVARQKNAWGLGYIPCNRVHS